MPDFAAAKRGRSRRQAFVVALGVVIAVNHAPAEALLLGSA